MALFYHVSFQLTARMSKTKTLRFIVQAECKQAEDKKWSTHIETALMKMVNQKQVTGQRLLRVNKVHR